jgi:hypothetical protein
VPTAGYSARSLIKVSLRASQTICIKSCDSSVPHVCKPQPYSSSLPNIMSIGYIWERAGCASASPREILIPWLRKECGKQDSKCISGAENQTGLINTAYWNECVLWVREKHQVISLPFTSCVVLVSFLATLFCS